MQKGNTTKDLLPTPLKECCTWLVSLYFFGRERHVFHAHRVQSEVPLRSRSTEMVLSAIKSLDSVI